MPGERISESRPWESNSCGCSPREAERLTEEFRRHTGCKTGHFDPQTGKAIGTTNKARAELMKFRGQMDLNAGYSDHAGS